jgi:hypothetical protein
MIWVSESACDSYNIGEPVSEAANDAELENTIENEAA